MNPFKAGKPASARVLNEMHQGARRIAGLSASLPLEMQDAGQTRLLSLGLPVTFEAIVTRSGNAYSFKEAKRLRDGPIGGEAEELTGGRTGTAYELNSLNVPNGSVVVIRGGANADDWRFAWTPKGVGIPVCNNCLFPYLETDLELDLTYYTDYLPTTANTTITLTVNPFNYQWGRFGNVGGFWETISNYNLFTPISAGVTPSLGTSWFDRFTDHNFSLYCSGSQVRLRHSMRALTRYPLGSPVDWRYAGFYVDFLPDSITCNPLSITFGSTIAEATVWGANGGYWLTTLGTYQFTSATTADQTIWPSYGPQDFSGVSYVITEP